MSSDSRTDESLVGRKVALLWDHGKTTLLASIDCLDDSYPRTAYAVSWTRTDNPHWHGWDDIPIDVETVCSIAHCSKIHVEANT